MASILANAYRAKGAPEYTVATFFPSLAPRPKSAAALEAALDAWAAKLERTAPGP